MVGMGYLVKSVPTTPLWSGGSASGWPLTTWVNSALPMEVSSPTTTPPTVATASPHQRRSSQINARCAGGCSWVILATVISSGDCSFGDISKILSGNNDATTLIEDKRIVCLSAPSGKWHDRRAALESLFCRLSDDDQARGKIIPFVQGVVAIYPAQVPAGGSEQQLYLITRDGCEDGFNTGTGEGAVLRVRVVPVGEGERSRFRTETRGGGVSEDRPRHVVVPGADMHHLAGLGGLGKAARLRLSEIQCQPASRHHVRPQRRQRSTTFSQRCEMLQAPQRHEGQVKIAL